MKVFPKTSFIDSKTNKSYQYNNQYEIEDKRAEELADLDLVEIVIEDQGAKKAVKKTRVKKK